MKIIINKWTISILAIGLLASGCASNSNDTGILPSLTVDWQRWGSNIWARHQCRKPQWSWRQI